MAFQNRSITTALVSTFAPVGNGNPDVGKIVCSINQILNGNYKISLNMNPQSELEPVAALIEKLCDELQSCFSAAKNIARGDFSSDIESSRGLAAALKTVQANFRHLTWQSREVAKGDLSQRIIAMGELSESFNAMVSALKNARDEVNRSNLTLEKKVEERTGQLQQAYISAVRSLAIAIDEKDHYTHNHSNNVARCAVYICKRMGLSEKETTVVEQASQLHDVGKIGIHDAILLKTSRLSPQEWDEIERHPVKGAQILQPLVFLNGAAKMVKQHHERVDGKGYPDRLEGNSICLGAKIIAVADAFDAMNSDRPYRTAMTRDEIVTVLKENAGTQWDAMVVQTFLEVLDNEGLGLFKRKLQLV